MVLVFCLHRAAHYACFVSMVAFCTRLSDPRVGAVNTASRDLGPDVVCQLDDNLILMA